MSLLPEHFHFLRPAWFWAFIPLLLLTWWYWRQKLVSRSWQTIVDPRLLPHLLIGDAVKKPYATLGVISITGFLAIIALAGPAWNKLEQPVFRQQSGLVILLDLSRSMDAADIKPSRLTRAKLKLYDILKQRKEGQTAIITYAADPFVVTPLTTDTRTISSQLSGLKTDLMPMQGSRADRAINKGITLLQQAGMNTGAVLLVTDGIEGTPVAELNQQIQGLTSHGYRLLVLGVGTKEGAPIPQATGGFFKDNQGNIILPKLDPVALNHIASQGHGIYQSLSADDSDITHLLAAVNATTDSRHNQRVNNMKSDQWQDQGYWLLLPLLLLAALGFRRGYVLLLLIIILPAPQPAYAFEWSHLWSTDNQRAQQAFNKGDTREAAKLFKDPQWRAAAKYKSGEYKESLEEQEKISQKHDIDSAQTLYNKGNTLAQLHRFPEALAAYNEALKHNPELQDAKYNRDLVKKWLQQNKAPDKNKSSQQSKDSKDGQSQQDKNQKNNKASNKGTPQQSSKDKNDEDKPGKQSPSQQDKKQASNSDESNKDLKQDKKPADAKQNAATEKNNQQAATKDSKADEKNPEKIAGEAKLNNETDQATEQWLRRIPDDPAGLWRRKFLYQYQKQYQSQKEEEKPW